MHETLKALYYGNISPFEDPIHADSPYHKLLPKLAKCEATLTKLQDEADRQLVKDFIEIYQQINSITAEENFIRGFRLGVQLMAECLTETQGGDSDG